MEEAGRVHQRLEARLAALQEGLACKDAQLERIAVKQAEATRDGAEARSRVERAGEELRTLRHALLEKADDNESLRRSLGQRT